MEAWRAAAEGLNETIINPGIIIGSGNWNSSSGELFGSFEKYPFAMRGTAAYVDVRDVATIAVELMDKNIFDQKFILFDSFLPVYEEAKAKMSDHIASLRDLTPNNPAQSSRLNEIEHWPLYIEM